MPAAPLEFTAVYSAFHDRIERYLARLLGEAEAPDAAQDVFLKVSRSLPRFRGDCSLSTWLYRIATRTAVDRIRSTSFRGDESAEPFDEELSAPPLLDQPCPPDELVMRREMYGCFDRYVQELPAAYRAAVVLSEVEQLPDREIAEVLGLTLGTVKIRLHRGRALLLARLKLHCKAEDWL